MFTFEAANHGLQMDFSAMYTAGSSLNHGFDPYQNNVYTEPVTWDGIAYYEHSRFLYPPLAANLFQPFAALPYHWAKWLWSLLTLGGIALAVWLIAKAMHLKPKWWEWSIVAIIGLNIYPLYILLERGQVDGIVIGLVAAGIYYGLKQGRSAFAGGAFIALACLLKLYLVFLVPFLLLRKKWSVLIGFAGTGLVMVLLTLALHGTEGFSSYLNNHLPRILKHGEKGPDSVRLDQNTLIALHQNVTKQGHTEVQGKDYIKGLFQFDSSAGWVGILKNFLTTLGWKNVSVATTSFIGLALFIILFFYLQQKVFPMEITPFEETILLLAGCIVTLFIGPLTWVMSLVWLIPLALAPVARFRELPKWVIAIFGLAFLLLILPDSKAWPALYPEKSIFLGSKYHLIQVLLLIGVIFTLKRHHSKPTEAA